MRSNSESNKKLQQGSSPFQPLIPPRLSFAHHPSALLPCLLLVCTMCPHGVSHLSTHCANLLRCPVLPPCPLVMSPLQPRVSQSRLPSMMPHPWPFCCSQRHTWLLSDHTHNHHALPVDHLVLWPGHSVPFVVHIVQPTNHGGTPASSDTFPAAPPPFSSAVFLVVTYLCLACPLSGWSYSPAYWTNSITHGVGRTRTPQQIKWECRKGRCEDNTSSAEHNTTIKATPSASTLVLLLPRCCSRHLQKRNLPAIFSQI